LRSVAKFSGETIAERCEFWLYTKALIAFRENEPDGKRGEELVKKAWKAIAVFLRPAVLVSAKKAKPSANGKGVVELELSGDLCRVGISAGNLARPER
jgi:hypothetical protein